MDYTIVHIADIHFGASKPDILYRELSEIFLNKLYDLKILHAIIIEGDFYDHKLSMNSTHAKYALKFLVELAQICKIKNAKLRILKGTESHDNKQLELFDIAMKVDENLDIKIISHVDKEMLLEGFNVLYIPEEYITSIDYYNEYFNDKYDMVVGHGMFKEVSFSALEQESEITHSKAPIFLSNDILNICKGPIFFGHIHKSQIIKDRIFYVGSFSRWCFGEEEDKGFYISYHKDNGYSVDFIVNKIAPIYDTVEIECVNERVDLNKIFAFVDSLSYDNLRIKVNLSDDMENPYLFTTLINDHFVKYKNIKVIVNNANKIKSKEASNNKINDLMEKYEFVFDKSISHEEKISKFIKTKYNRDIDIDRVKHFLYDQILTYKGEK